MDGKDILVVAVHQVQLHLEAVLQVHPLDGKAAEGILLSVIVVKTWLFPVGSRKYAPSLLPLLKKRNKKVPHGFAEILAVLRLYSRPLTDYPFNEIHGAFF